MAAFPVNYAFAALRIQSYYHAGAPHIGEELFGASGMSGGPAASGAGWVPTRFSEVPHPWEAPKPAITPNKRYGWSPAPWNPSGD